MTTMRAEVRDVRERLEAGGVVAAAVSATITSRILAPIRDVHVRAGDRVRAGQTLVTLDAREMTARARQAESMLAAAEQALTAARAERDAAAAELTAAESWHRRIAALHAVASATAQELENAQARLDTARARATGAQAGIDRAGASVEAAKAAVESAAAAESYAVIDAPFDGIVTERLTDPGNLASPGVPLLRLESGGATRVEATIDEARAPYIRIGDRVQVVLDSTAVSNGVDATVDARVVEMARVVAADERAFLVKVALPPGLDVRSGSFARIRFDGPARRALVVPEAAVRRQGQVVTAFVVQDDVARLRLLRTADAGDAGVEVLAGLEAGELVITGVPPDLADGRRVTTGAATRAPADR